MSTKAQVKIEGIPELVAKLNSLPAAARGESISKAMDDAGRIVSSRMRELVPQPGSPGYSKRYGKRQAKSKLVDAIDNKTLSYRSEKFVGSLAVIRPSLQNGPAARHRHLVQWGHRLVRGGSIQKKQGGTAPKAVSKDRRGTGKVVGWVEGRDFIRRAFTDTESQATSAIISGLEASINEWISQNSEG